MPNNVSSPFAISNLEHPFPHTIPNAPLNPNCDDITATLFCKCSPLPIRSWLAFRCQDFVFRLGNALDATIAMINLVPSLFLSFIILISSILRSSHEITSPSPNFALFPRVNRVKGLQVKSNSQSCFQSEVVENE